MGSGAKVQALAGLKHGSGVFLLRSLYESQAWARELVDAGKYGMRAHVIDDDQHLLTVRFAGLTSNWNSSRSRPGLRDDAA